MLSWWVLYNWYSVGAEKDVYKAFKYYSLSAEAGDPRGEGALGFSYGEGFGVAKDHKKAVQYYLSAALKGESVSMYNLGFCYEQGQYVQQDYIEVVFLIHLG